MRWRRGSEKAGNRDQGSGIRVAGWKLGDHFDWADNLAVEFFKFPGGDPVFLMNSGAGLLHGKLIEVIAVNLEAKDIASRAVPCVPVAGNLCGVLLIQHGIKDRLFGEAWRKSAPVGCTDECKLTFPCWSIESCHWQLLGRPLNSL